MTERTRLEKRLIEMCRNILDASEAHDIDSAEMAKEIRFARKALAIWETQGAQESARWVASGLAVKRALDAA